MPDVVVGINGPAPVHDRSVGGVRVSEELQELVRDQPENLYVTTEARGGPKAPGGEVWRGQIAFRKGEGVTLTLAWTHIAYPSEDEAEVAAQAVLDQLMLDAHHPEEPGREPGLAELSEPRLMKPDAPVEEIVEKAEALDEPAVPEIGAQKGGEDGEGDATAHEDRKPRAKTRRKRRRG